MNHTELRSGNIVMVNDHFIKVGYHEIRYATINPDNNYEAIPLHERWLRMSDIEYKDLNGDDGCWIKDGLCFYEGQDGISYDGKLIPYVHRLQNIFQSVTGKELELNIP